jgi:glycosyltransferase involved in cell wall biosynthesis
MRIALLTQYYPPEIGAPQGRLSGLAAAFQRAGHTVSVLTAMPNYPSGRIHAGYGGIVRREVRDGVRITRTFVYPTQRADFLHRLSSYFSFVASSATLGTFLLESPDYLIVESPPLFLGLAGMWLSWVKRCPMIFNVADLWPETAVRIGVLQRSGLAYGISAALERLCYRRATLVTGQTRAIVADIEARFPWCRTYHLSNGVDSRTFHPGQRTAAARATLGPADSCVAFYAGLHGLAQGLDRVLDAAALVTDTPLRFVFMGDGPTKADLMRQARANGLDNVTFLDPRPTNEVPPLLAAADIVVVPLVTHIPGATPSKLYEAMASGRPVILVAEGEPAAIVRDAEAGLVVDPGDMAGLAAALRRLSCNPALRQALGENGRRTAERLFNQAEIDGRFVAFLEQQHDLAAAPSGASRGGGPRPATRGEVL